MKGGALLLKHADWLPAGRLPHSAALRLIYALIAWLVIMKTLTRKATHLKKLVNAIGPT
jgi:hypothetical protein